ncbi:MAG: hypothetical protein ABIK07_25870 [Planctomycetota bacterium]
MNWLETKTDKRKESTMITNFNEVPFGSLVRDVVTGFEGVVIARDEWDTGCKRIGVQPKGLTEEGKAKSMGWIDLQKVELIWKPGADAIPDLLGGPCPEKSTPNAR